MVPLTGQNTVNDMVDRINEVSQEIEDVSYVNANAVMGPASSVTDQIMAFSDTTGKNAKAANISPFAYSILDDADDAAARATLGLKSAAVLDAATAATPNTAVQRDVSGNITGAGIIATSGFVGNGSQITSLDMNNAASGALAVAYGGTGATTASGSGSIVKAASPTLTGTPLSSTALADTNTAQIATTAFVIGQASSTAPLMDGVAAVGTSLRYARANHVHPSDTTKVNTSLLGAANGVATLDSAGKVPTSQLPAYVDDVLEYAYLASFPATGETGKIYVALDTNKTYRWSGSAYVYITSGAVDSVAGKTGVVTLAKGDVGLGDVDNTSDVNKPVSTAQQNALNLKANLASPALTGTPTAPTAAVGTNTTQLATTAFVQAEIANDAPSKTGAGASGSWGISVTGNAATATKLATARTINGVAFDGTADITVADATKLPLAGGNLTGDLSITKDNPWLSLDSNSTGVDGVEQGAGISIGESGKKSNAALHLTYTGDGYGHIGMGIVDPTSGIPAYRAMSFFYENANVTFHGTMYGNGSGLTDLNANQLTSGTIPDARLSGTYTGVNITGNAGTATKLATARTIGGVSFDGSSNINLPGVNAAGNQSTTGNAATATKLQTARTINGVAFDGTTNITVGVDWTGVTNKPSTYAPSAHTHAHTEITGLGNASTATVTTSTTDTTAGRLLKVDHGVNLGSDQTVPGRKAFTAIPHAGGIADSTGSLGSIEVTGDVQKAAMITLHRHGAYGVYFGLDTDNKLKVGGWSMGATAHEIYHTGNWYLGADKQHTASATGTVTLDFATASIFDLTLTGTTTLAVSNATVPSGYSRSVVVRVRQGTTPYTLTWWGGITWIASSTPAAPGANKVVEYVMSYSETGWIGRVGAKN